MATRPFPTAKRDDSDGGFLHPLLLHPLLPQKPSQINNSVVFNVTHFTSYTKLAIALANEQNKSMKMHDAHEVSTAAVLIFFRV